MKQRVVSFPLNPGIRLKSSPCRHRPALALQGLCKWAIMKGISNCREDSFRHVRKLAASRALLQTSRGLHRHSIGCYRFRSLQWLGQQGKDHSAACLWVGGEDGVMGYGLIWLNSIWGTLPLVRHPVCYTLPMPVVLFHIKAKEIYFLFTVFIVLTYFIRYWKQS